MTGWRGEREEEKRDLDLTRGKVIERRRVGGGAGGGRSVTDVNYHYRLTPVGGESFRTINLTT